MIKYSAKMITLVTEHDKGVCKNVHEKLPLDTKEQLL